MSYTGSWEPLVYVILCKSVILVILYIQADGTNITVKNTSEDKNEKTNTSIGSSSSLSSESETSEMTENSDCGQEPGEVDINKANKSKMKPVFATKPVCTYNMSR